MKTSEFLNFKAKIKVIFLVIFMFISCFAFSQNIAVTDSSTYSAKGSAMLDVQSFSKGMLVPRMSTSQRLNISNPADGLLVYDTEKESFYFNQNNNWIRLSSVNESSGDNDPLFYVSNSSQDTIFAVYNDGVKITLPKGTKGNVGGFAVSGRTVGKQSGEYDILRVNMDSTRIYVKDTSYAKGRVGGFAVSGRTVGKTGSLKKIFYANQDSTRIFIDTTASKGNVGGFAVSGRTVSKGSGNLLDMTHENYFIGQGSGASITTGLYNSFIGYESGKYVTEGDENVFLGYRSGHNVEVADYNVFIGSRSGYSNTGSGGESGDYNSFIGYESGFNNSTGNHNSFFGYRSGYNNNANFNIFIGHEAGYTNQNGNANTYIGYKSGSDTEGSSNTFIGYSAGWIQDSGDKNTYVGSLAGHQQPSGTGNSYFGYRTARNNGGGDYNVIMGYQAGLGTYLNAYSNNVFLGAESGYSVVSGSNNVFIGYQAGYNETGSDKLYIESSSGGKDDALIYGDFSANNLQFNGGVRIANWANIYGQIGLAVDSDGESTDTILRLRSAPSAGSWTTDGIRMRVMGDGKVFMNDVPGSSVSGSPLYINTSTGQLGLLSSSRRYKESIRELIDISWIYKLNPVSFIYKNDRDFGTQYGLIAEEVEKVNKDFVTYNSEGLIESVRYNLFVPVLIETVQKQNEKIEEQKKTNEHLEKEIEYLKEQINLIKEELTKN